MPTLKCATRPTGDANATLYCPPVIEDSEEQLIVPVMLSLPVAFPQKLAICRPLHAPAPSNTTTSPSLPLQTLIVTYGSQKTHCQAISRATRRSVTDSRPRVFMRTAGLAPVTSTEPSVELHTRCQDLPPAPYDKPTYIDPVLGYSRFHRLRLQRLCPLSTLRIDLAVLAHMTRLSSPQQLPLRSPDARRGTWRCRELAYGSP
ncbi:hypothetical protein C8F01DRAFT_1254138 [Mycena amicta]|nr:hypothetical protein C8F01DRAFT_1254138 [Mycena amicta]